MKPSTNTKNMPPISTTRKKYSSVLQMVQDVSDDKDFNQNLANQIEDRCLVTRLIAMRVAQGLSQSDIAQKVGCTQSRISKLENGKDDDLTFAEFRKYTEALGCKSTILIRRGERKLVDEVKYHILSTRRLLIQMTDLTSDDPETTKGFLGFTKEVIFNFFKSVEAAISQFKTCHPKSLEIESPPVQVDDSLGYECSYQLKASEKEVCV